MTSARAELGMTGRDRLLVLLGFPLVGAVVGLVLPYLWRLVEDVEWLPLRGPVSSLMELDHGWQVVLRVGLLAVGGLVLALVAVDEDTRLSIGPDDLVVRQGRTSRTIPRDQVAGVRLEGRTLLVETAQGRRLLEAEVERARSEAGPAFRRFGWPWENDDL